VSKDPRQDNQMRLDLAAALERQGLAAYQSGKGKVFASCGKLGFIELIFAGEAGLAWRIWVYGEGDNTYPLDALHRAVEQLKARLLEVRRTLARALKEGGA
jgi:hypothetical protein